MSELPKFAWSLVLIAVCFLGLTSVTRAWSPQGTPERAAEEVAAAKMKRDYPAYTVTDVEMRANKLSISIPTRNRIGNQVNFRCLTRKVTRRDGTVYYEVDAPDFVR